MKVNALTAEKYVIEQERLVVSAVTELNNFRLSEWISTVRLNECVYDVMWDHPVFSCWKELWANGLGHPLATTEMRCNKFSCTASSLTPWSRSYFYQKKSLAKCTLRSVQQHEIRVSLCCQWFGLRVEL